MAVTDKDVIDSIAYEEENHLLILQIYDHLGFEGKFEYDHMMILQDKLNTYIWYIESGQYKEVYPETDFLDYKYKINIYFMCEITELCKNFLEHVNKKLLKKNIHIEYFHKALNTSTR